jgi:hypothetical protein
MFGSKTKFRRAIPLFGTTLLAAFSFGCGGGDGPSAPDTSGDDVPAPSVTTGFRITNSSNRSAFYIYFKACGTEEWGEDRLGSRNVLSSGESFTSAVPVGCYDVLALSEPSGPPYYQIHLQQQSVTAGQTTSIAFSSGDWQSVQSVVSMASLSMGRK